MIKQLTEVEKPEKVDSDLKKKKIEEQQFIKQQIDFEDPTHGAVDTSKLTQMAIEA